MKKRYLVILCFCVIGLLVCVYLGVSRYKGATEENTDLEALRDSIKVFETASSEETEAAVTDIHESETLPVVPETEETVETEPVEESEFDSEVESVVETQPAESEAPAETIAETEKVTTEQVEYTLNFDPLWQLNPEIYAWIEIKGTKVDYPVLQSPNNDSKYLTTAYDGSWYIGGSLFTQATYNNTDFNDPVTVIYGHTMMSGTLFGQLQSVYTNPATFASHDDIIIYLPGEVRHYTVFAAVPFERHHILDTYDFSVKYWYDRFFDQVSKIRSFSACFNRELMPEFGDRVLILSTCLNENVSKRFLVMAVCRDGIADTNGSGS